MTVRRTTVCFLVLALISSGAVCRAAADGLDPVPDCGFRLLLGDPGDTDLSHRVEVRSGEMSSVSDRQEGGRLVRVWKGHPRLGDAFTAEAVFTRGADGSVECGFSYAGNTSRLPVEAVGFPDIAFARTDRTRILCSRSQGWITWPEWEKTPPGTKVAGGIPVSIHFIAALDTAGDSLYLDQRGDARLHATRLEAFAGEGVTARLVSWYDPVVGPETTAAFRVPYPMTFRRFRGGWFRAAEIYREWARTQDFWKRCAARDRGGLADISMWFWNRGRSGTVLPPVERFMADAGVPVALDWYWWHGIPYDSEFPHFWPPREPMEDFRAAVARCREKGIYVQPYVNGMTWDCDHPTWKDGGEQGAVVERDGSLRAYMFNRFTKHRLAYMCGEAPAYQKHMRGVLRNLAGCGFNAVYMDMINNAGWGPCWNPKHVHGPGGGTHMTENFRRYVAAVRKDNPGLMLSSEDGCEAYLECFDSVISLYADYERLAGVTMPRGEFVPAFGAVYHECITGFGSFAMIDGIPAFDEKWPAEERWTEEKEWERLFPDQFAVELARGPVWGLQPCVHNFLLSCADDPRYADGYRFMIDTARFWHAHRPWLLEGEMRDPGRLECDAEKVDFMRRSTYALKGEFSVSTEPALPTVFHSVWKAPDGRLAAVLVNWSRESRRWKLSSPDVSGEGTLPPRSWRLVAGSW